MSLHIVIDGYNLIRQSKRLSVIEDHSLKEGREALLECLASYKRVKDHPITVVFDGTYADTHMERRTRRKGIDVVFSRAGQLADTVIKRIVTQGQARVLVVTSDREIAEFAAEHGAVSISSTEFESKIEMATHPDLGPMDFSEEEGAGWIPTTKKKGPARRPSRRERKIRARTRKL